MTTLAAIEKVLHGRTEQELLEYERLELELLAQAHGGRLELGLKAQRGELSPDEHRIFIKAAIHVTSVGAQFF